jgi:hypothetical protein
VDETVDKILASLERQAVMPKGDEKHPGESAAMEVGGVALTRFRGLRNGIQRRSATSVTWAVGPVAGAHRTQMTGWGNV